MTKKRVRKSFLTCPHLNAGGFTEHCSDCGYNAYMSDEDYLDSIAREAGVSRHDSGYKIDLIEKKLGIKR